MTALPVPGAIPDYFATDARRAPARLAEPATALFVDDEPRVLAGLKNLLRRHRATVTSQFANSAEEAIELMARQTFDILATDIRMPRVDGLELLAHARKHSPGTARVILSGHAPQEAKLMCSPLAHQFLMKPCAPADLLTAFRRIIWAHQLLPDRDLRAALGKFSVFPQSPTTVRLVHDHQSGVSTGIEALAKACLSDVTLLARTLRIARCDRFDPSAPLDSVRKALYSLGGEPVARIAESVEHESRFDITTSYAWLRWSDETLHAFDVAIRTQKILEKTAPAFALQGALVGLLHDLGRLALLASYPLTMKALRGYPAIDKNEAVHREQELLGTDHAQVGAYLLALWGYPEEVVVPVLVHHHELGAVSEQTLSYAPILDALRIAECEANAQFAQPLELASELIPEGELLAMPSATPDPNHPSASAANLIPPRTTGEVGHG